MQPFVTQRDIEGLHVTSQMTFLRAAAILEGSERQICTELVVGSCLHAEHMLRVRMSCARRS